jgi:hypothetical protein
MPSAYPPLIRAIARDLSFWELDIEVKARMITTLDPPKPTEICRNL